MNNSTNTEFEATPKTESEIKNEETAQQDLSAAKTADKAEPKSEGIPLSKVIARKTDPLLMNSELERIIKYLQKAGYIGNPNITEKEIKAYKQKSAQTKIHNTELLLKNYHKYAWMIECYPENVARELEISFKDSDDLMAALDIQCAYGTRGLESMLQNYYPARAYIERLHEAVTTLKKLRHKGEMMYNVIVLRYLNPEELSVDEICAKLDITKRTYSRLRKEAVECISMRLWGADNKELSLALELASILSGLSGNN